MSFLSRMSCGKCDFTCCTPVHTQLHQPLTVLDASALKGVSDGWLVNLQTLYFPLDIFDGIDHFLSLGGCEKCELCDEEHLNLLEKLRVCVCVRVCVC